ncbi:TonB-dependent receptor plug domain-containing protein [Tanticharoenia sakaeratensis]|uniref:Outer membrane siderophore receptor n=1 Tax=Tanticharoenia sakaeratensis NBRC 103193 TaxID=1231623 RepID=A0A0D6MKP4_9PROT|nr:TonB-dependent receptor [Tanticharoenia sakaeratensis]GAN54046.1 outer membrane siderophore receptor [Tanticharoenia sakaeratensis NBRC 103193]GBQ23685.1 TonB-dependent receptor [Tanticharoenia sakaeratensis NBRC 103193]
MGHSLRFRKRILLSTSLAAGWLVAGVASASAQTATSPSVASPATTHAKAHHARKRPVKQVVRPAAASAVPAPAATSTTPSAPITAQDRRTLNASVAAPTPQHESIVVTGSLFRDPNIQSASPIVRMTASELQQRGIHNVTDALQSLSSNGAGNLTNSWSAGGGFAAGSSAPSLRGLSTDSTLVLMDGQRLSYYPLADDGERNYVDTNWMPSSIMQSVDVLQDGGSATYGADAVAGVINYTTRKEIKGFEGNAEGGLSQRGDAGHQKLYATYGFGDLDRDGYNVYVNSEYQQDDPVWYRQLQAPYNNGDLTGLGGTNGNTNVLEGGSIANFNQTPVPSARAVVNGVPTGPARLINQQAGCGSLGSVVTGSVYSGDNGQTQACTQNSQRYAQVAPSLRRINATIHGTVNVNDQSQLVTMFNYSQTLTDLAADGPSPARAYTQSLGASTLQTYEPVLLANGQLNPSNPYAAQGLQSTVYGDMPNIVRHTTEYSQNFRGSARYSGFLNSNWGGDWNYDVNFVGMNSTLDQTNTGYPYISHLQNAISTGAYNFYDPSATPQSVLDYIAPANKIHALTKEYSGEATINKGLFKLPGGMVRLAIGGNIRYEYLNDPSANPANLADPAEQYYSINPVNAHGHRWVESGFFELNVPIVKMLNADVSGRYDHYSEGFSHFSPKVGVQFKPMKELTLRGTFSRGFRVPSFAETGGSNVGYTPFQVTNAAWLAQHQVGGAPDAYAQNYYLGINTVGNPNLKPEISTNFNAGPVFTPTRWLTISADYYYIRKNHYITSDSTGYQDWANDWAAAYATGGASAAARAVPGTVTITPNPVDTQNPNGAPAPGIVNVGYINANKIYTDGADFSIQANTRLPGALHDVRWISQGNATFVHRFNLVLPDGTVNRYAGTLGPYEAVSGSGTPKWRANWSNTFIYKKLSVTPTVYYTSGYRNVADDAQTGSSTSGCANVLAGNNFVPYRCHTKGFWDVDLTVNYNVTKRWSVYANVYNLLGFRAPYDYGTYGGYLYNSSWSQQGVIMRSFQFGVVGSL